MAATDPEAYRAFVSYTHRDNSNESGRIVELVQDIASEYELLTAAELRLFLDIDAIDWGDKLLPSIGAALSEISFFIPIITPRYFKSEACRKELSEFTASARGLGLESLILPILYTDVAELHPSVG